MSTDTREIFLSGIQDTSLDHLDAINFLKELRYLDAQNRNPILIHLFTSGGEYDIMTLIYDAIKHAKSDTTILCHGLVASAGTIILQAATRRVSMPNCCFMFHAGDVELSAVTKTQARSWMDQTQKAQEWMLDILADKIKKGGRKFIEKMYREHEDWYLSAQEALELGFIDQILGDNNAS